MIARTKGIRGFHSSHVSPHQGQGDAGHCAHDPNGDCRHGHVRRRDGGAGNADHVEVAKQNTATRPPHTSSSPSWTWRPRAGTRCTRRTSPRPQAHVPHVGELPRVGAGPAGGHGLRPRHRRLECSEAARGCKAADWNSAAAECKRAGFRQERNDEIKAQLEGLVAKPCCTSRSGHSRRR